MYTSGGETDGFYSMLLRTDHTRPSVDEIDDAVTLDGDVLFRDHLDGFLCNHASEEGCSVGKLCGRRPSAERGEYCEMTQEGDRDDVSGAYSSPMALLSSSESGNSMPSPTMLFACWCRRSMVGGVPEAFPSRANRADKARCVHVSLG